MTPGKGAEGEAAPWRVTSIEASDCSPPFAEISGVGDFASYPELIIFGINAHNNRMQSDHLTATSFVGR